MRRKIREISATIVPSPMRLNRRRKRMGMEPFVIRVAGPQRNCCDSGCSPMVRDRKERNYSDSGCGSMVQDREVKDLL
ncbi:hypothetical protein U1Q18_032512 [Sarracenia purpurea var. burkii]